MPKLPINQLVHLLRRRIPYIYKLTYATASQSATGSDAGVKASPLSAVMSKDVPQEKSSKGSEEESQQKSREASWRTIKYSLMAFGASFTILGGYLIVTLGRPGKDDTGSDVIDEFSHMPLLKQYFLRMFHELDYYKRMIKEPSREKLLPDALTYYQPPYTLVLELTDLLVHPEWTYRTGWRFKKRPGIDIFLETVGRFYEVVIYTAEQGMTVFPIVESLDPNNIIMYKLFRDATHFVDGHHVKSLDRLNRDLSKVIVVDWNMDSVKFHRENVFCIPRWQGNDDDRTLLDLAEFLKTIAEANFTDLREVLQHYEQYDDPLRVFRERQEQEAAKADKTTRAEPVVKKWAPSFLRRSI